jgi:RNA polymerase Rpb3/Rpb11 dimerisation domain
MFIFRVESTGVLPPADIVTTALEVLQNKLSTINGSLQTSKDAGDDPMQVG